MAILKIARMGHPILATKAAPVSDPTAPEIRRLVNDMVETMIDANGAGLAAPQVHVPLRVVVFQAPRERSEPSNNARSEPLNQERSEPSNPVDPGLSDEAFDHTAPLTVLVNPEIAVMDHSIEGGWEGCLSVPGLRGWVERPAHIRYRGFGLDGKVIERSARGFHARVVQHECDHLDGRLYPGRMADLSRLIFESEARHFLEPA
ncbi:MAG TPA: peptide deformylase [Rhizomicrobium sp.]|nr:peptide deformylase [Rhizomicrobium sp.]